MASNSSTYWKNLYNKVLNKGTTYKLSDGTKNAYQNWKKAYKTGFSSGYDSSISELVDAISSRGEFSLKDNDYYNTAYNIYRDQYERLGKKAMQDTVSGASSLTGGYSNSYAVTAGNEAYNSYLNQLNDIIPSLYAQAYDMYQEEGKSLRDKLDTYNALRSDEYKQWNSYLDNLYNNYSLLFDKDYKKYQSSYNKWRSKLQGIYNNYKSALASEQNQRNLAYKYASLNARKSKSSKSSKKTSSKTVDGMAKSLLDRVAEEAYNTVSRGGNFAGFSKNYSDSQLIYLSKKLNSLLGY